MYIEPNGRIYVLKNCPLDLSFDHTIYFSDKDKQRKYFESLAKYKLTDQSYSRPNQGVLKVEIPADKIYDCNYIMFQNTSYGNKWFYAYIRSIEYVNNEVSRINFVIDVMQTWFFDYQLEECFIEREHTRTDRIGENLVDEGLELGEFLVENTYTYWNDWRRQSINIVCTFDTDASGEVDTSEYASGGFYSNIYSGLHIYSFPCTIVGTTMANSFLRKVTSDGASAGVVSVFMCPTFMVQEKRGASIDDGYPENRLRTMQKPYSNIDGYVPKNKKLFNYPYKFLQVTTDTGDDHVYHYELFKRYGSTPANTYSFREYYIFSPQPECCAIPIEYRGQAASRDERVNLSDFPNCAFTIDSYLAWLAQKRVSLPYEAVKAVVMPAIAGAALMPNASTAPMSASTALVPSVNPAIGFGGTPYAGYTGIGAIGAGISGAAGMSAAGAAVGAVAGAVNFALDNLKQKALAEIKPPSCNGSIAGGGMMTALYQKGFDYKQMCIRAEYAKRIDNFFTVFGYKVNRLGVPVLNARPHWTYVKTINCCIRGSVPCDDAKEICSIFDRGITFWKNGNEVGNYSLDNSV